MDRIANGGDTDYEDDEVVEPVGPGKNVAVQWADGSTSLGVVVRSGRIFLNARYSQELEEPLTWSNITIVAYDADEPKRRPTTQTAHVETVAIAYREGPSRLPAIPLDELEEINSRSGDRSVCKNPSVNGPFTSFVRPVVEAGGIVCCDRYPSAWLSKRCSMVPGDQTHTMRAISQHPASAGSGAPEHEATLLTEEGVREFARSSEVLFARPHPDAPATGDVNEGCFASAPQPLDPVRLAPPPEWPVPSNGPGTSGQDVSPAKRKRPTSKSARAPVARKRKGAPTKRAKKEDGFVEHRNAIGSFLVFACMDEKSDGAGLPDTLRRGWLEVARGVKALKKKPDSNPFAMYVTAAPDVTATGSLTPLRNHLQQFKHADKLRFKGALGLVDEFVRALPDQHAKAFIDFAQNLSQSPHLDEAVQASWAFVHAFCTTKDTRRPLQGSSAATKRAALAKGVEQTDDEKLMFMGCVDLFGSAYLRE